MCTDVALRTDRQQLIENSHGIHTLILTLVHNSLQDPSFDMPPKKRKGRSEAAKAAIAAKVNPPLHPPGQAEPPDPAQTEANTSTASDSEGDLGPFGRHFRDVTLSTHPVWSSPQTIEKLQRFYSANLQPYQHANDWTFPASADLWGLQIWDPFTEDTNHTAILHSKHRGPSCYVRDGETSSYCHYREHIFAFLYKCALGIWT